eukprot:58066-Chlamydomonas_euryale.AAC.1
MALQRGCLAQVTLRKPQVTQAPHHACQLGITAVRTCPHPSTLDAARMQGRAIMRSRRLAGGGSSQPQASRGGGGPVRRSPHTTPCWHSVP